MGRRPIGHALGMAEGHAVVRGPMAQRAMGPEPRAQLRWALKNKILKYGPQRALNGPLWAL